METGQKIRLLVGWIGVLISTAITCFWAMWGIIENFHEGWYHENILSNFVLMFGQYLSPMIGFLLLAVVSIRWPVFGGAAHLVLALFAFFFFKNSYAAQTLIVAPLVILSVFYFVARIPSKKLAASITLACTATTLVCFGAEPVYRVSHRYDDGYLGERRIVNQGRGLIWAPIGPGWPTSGTTWNDAVDICGRLMDDGTTLNNQTVNIWRLPTASEIVTAQHRDNRPCNGRFDTGTRMAEYEMRPDKESPIWNPHSQVIYLWTATEVDDETALMIAYDGKLWPRPKMANWGYLGFRAVRNATEQTDEPEPE